MCKEPVRKVVGLELGFVSIGGEGEWGGHDIGVGDQAVEMGL